MKIRLLERVIDHYLASRDFIGIPYGHLTMESDITGDDVVSLLSELLSEKSIEIMFGDYHPNPHIKALSVSTIEEQIEKLNDEQLLNQSCIYPTTKTLDAVPNLDRKYPGRPYSLELARGASQFDFRSFDLEILETYRNNPRFYYENDDIRGKIWAKNEHSEEMRDSDTVYLQTFGFSYNEGLDRAVAVFLRYLHSLSPEHQQMWNAREIKGNYKLHPDYYLNARGYFGTKISIFDAFTCELEIINIMCLKMNKPGIFKKTFRENRPPEFGFLLRPTLKEFNEFVHLLDKMMSENIEKDFFRDSIELEIEKERGDGKIVLTQKGTIQLLEEWLSRFFRPSDPENLVAVVSPFKEVRKLRQNPAHSVQENKFDQSFFKQQRALIVKAYKGIRNIRLIMANHPLVKRDPPQIDRFLFEGEIWDF